jgi:hypothetical protein
MSDQQIIVVNYPQLEQSRRSLASIGDEFEHVAAIKDQLVGHLGSGDIADAMADFSGNWNRRCHDLTKKIRSVEGIVSSVIASFSEQDRAGATYDLSYQAGPKMTATEVGR